MKYVSLFDRELKATCVVVFDEALIHRFIAHGARRMNPDLEIRGAGFVYFDGTRWKVSNRLSESLNLGPHPDDEEAINKALQL